MVELDEEGLGCSLHRGWRSRAVDVGRPEPERGHVDVGEEDFLVEKDALPLCFHEVAKSTPWHGQGQFWTTSTTAFGASGIPGEVPPFTALEIYFTQQRPVLDPSWLDEVQKGTFEEEVWLKAF